MKLSILAKEIELDECRALYDAPFTEATFATDWESLGGGEWWVEGEWLTGRNSKNCPAVVLSRFKLVGNVMLDFEARVVAPCTHDIDFMWNATWDYESGSRGTAYIGGLAGWWTNKTGLEKSPEYKLNALVPFGALDPERTYRVQAGSIDGHAFIFVDGRLIIEVIDPNPIDTQQGSRFGFEAYASHIQIRNLKVLTVAWRPVEMAY